MALESVAASFHYSSSSELLEANAPLLVHKISMAFRDLPNHANSPLILSELLRLAPSTSALTPCPQDQFVEQVISAVDELMGALDRYDQKGVLPLLQAVQSYVGALGRWFPNLRPPEESLISEEEDSELVAPEEQSKCELIVNRRKNIRHPLVDNVEGILAR